MDKDKQQFQQFESDTVIVLEQSRNVLYGSNDASSSSEIGYGAGVVLRGAIPDVNTHSMTDWDNVGDVVSSNHVPSKSNDTKGADPNCIPQWAKDMRRQLENIQTTLDTQNTRWLTVEKQLESQNVRMTNIETQMSQISIIKEKAANNEVKLISTSNEVGEMQEKIQEYDRSIHYYSQVCDDLIQSNTGLKENVDELSNKVDYILKKQAESNIKQSNTEKRLLICNGVQ